MQYLFLPKGPEKITLTNKEDLKGVTVLGKIDLAEREVRKFQQVASSDLEKKTQKRPRKRVAKPGLPPVSRPDKKEENNLSNKTKIKMLRSVDLLCLKKKSKIKLKAH